MIKVLLFQNPYILLGLFLASMWNLNTNPILFAELFIVALAYGYIMVASNYGLMTNILSLMALVGLLLGFT